MEGAYSGLFSRITSSAPNFIEVQEALRSTGPVQKNQLVTNSNHMMTFCNAIRQIWTKCVDRFVMNGAFSGDSFDKKLGVDEIAKYLYKAGKPEMFAKAETTLRPLGPTTFFDILAGLPGASESLSDSIISCIRRFLEDNTAIRWITNLERHMHEPDFIFRDDQYETVLEFLNDDDFETKIPKIAAGAILLLGIVENEFEYRDPETLNYESELIKECIEKSCADSETSSLKMYEQRLNNLVWGPKHYQRDDQFIRDASNALKDNKIVAFYGLGGVGKTALAQKLMFDIINNREPFTHIVTHSSKVGSDQKEINTISPNVKGTLSETNQSISVMDSALIEDRGMRVIGGLRNLLSKIYRETTGSSGDQFGDVILRRKVLDELKKVENQVLIVLDNYEDIEDNQDDDDVLQIKNEMKEFLDEFSKLPSIKSRIIITTRSSPMDIAYGLEVKHLTKLESANLFLEKIRFRSQRTDQHDTTLSSTLFGVHQKLSKSEVLKNQLIDSFDLWDTRDEHIAHPLIVILAAEDVERDDFDHLREVITSWGSGTKNKNVIQYCVSKTLGSFSVYEQEILRRLTINSNLSSEMNTKFIREKINEYPVLEVNRLEDANPTQEKIASVQDSELFDLMTRLGDRTFVRVIPKRTTSGGTCWAWNKIVYDYLVVRYGADLEDETEPTGIETKEELKRFPEFLTPLHRWKTSEPLLMSELITPLGRSVESMMKDLAKHADNQKPAYDIETIASNLNKQSFLLLKLLDKIEKHTTLDRSLSTLATVKTSVDRLINDLLKFLGRQARCWRYLSSTKNSNFPPAICVQYAIEMLNKVDYFSTRFFSSTIITKDHYLNLLENIGKEHVEIYDDYVEVSGTLSERMATMKLDWLEKIASLFNPEDCSLRQGLEFSDEQYRIHHLWIQVFERTNLNERTKQLAITEGYGFWIYLRLFATNRQFTETHDSQILNELKSNAAFVRKVPNIHQYVQSVQEGIDRMLRVPDEYLKSIVNFRSQPTNGTLLMTGLTYNPEDSRWEQDLERPGWKIIARETDKDHTQTKYDSVILVQESFIRTSKRIVCSFHRGSDGKVTLEPKDSMTLMAELEKAWKEDIQILVKERIDEGRNELSFWELRRVFEQQGGPGDSESIDEIITRITTLSKIDNYYVIDINKKYSEPPPAYLQFAGGKDVFSGIWSSTKIVLPPQPSRFAAYLIALLNLLSMQGVTTMKIYREKIRKDFHDGDASGHFFIYHALGGPYSPDWQQKEIHSFNYSHAEFIKKIGKSVKGMCPKIEQKTGRKINRKIIDSYFSEVLESFIRQTE